MTTERSLPALLVGCVLVALAASPAQELRHAAVAADRVVVGTVVSVRPIGKDWIVHRLKVARTLKGEAAEFLQIVEPKQLAMHHRPTPAQQRVYCLHDVPPTADLAPLAGNGPLTKVTGHADAAPLVKTSADDEPALVLVRLVLESEAGKSAKTIAPQVVALVALDDAAVRAEAVRMLTERSVLRDALTRMQWSDLVARAVGESQDVPLKIALAELCAEHRIDRLVESLCVSFDTVHDPRWSNAVGRIAKFLHGENAIDVLRPFVERPRDPKSRAALLLAIGHSDTAAAREALLRMRAIGEGKDAAVEAALEAAGVKTPKDADAKGTNDKK
jgi:hypothetical protein